MDHTRISMYTARNFLDQAVARVEEEALDASVLTEEHVVNRRHDPTQIFSADVTLAGWEAYRLTVSSAFGETVAYLKCSYEDIREPLFISSAVNVALHPQVKRIYDILWERAHPRFEEDQDDYSPYYL